MRFAFCTVYLNALGKNMISIRTYVLYLNIFLSENNLKQLSNQHSRGFQETTQPAFTTTQPAFTIISTNYPTSIHNYVKKLLNQHSQLFQKVAQPTIYTWWTSIHFGLGRIEFGECSLTFLA